MVLLGMRGKVRYNRNSVDCDEFGRTYRSPRQGAGTHAADLIGIGSGKDQTKATNLAQVAPTEECSIMPKTITATTPGFLSPPLPSTSSASPPCEESENGFLVSKNLTVQSQDVARPVAANDRHTVPDVRAEKRTPWNVSGPDSLHPTLLDTIFEHVRDEKRTLSKLSLVCRQWSAPAQRQLFRSLKFFVGGVSHISQMKNTNRFFTKNPHLKHLVTSLIISSKPKGKGKEKEAVLTLHAKSPFPSLLATLSKLQHLVFQDITIALPDGLERPYPLPSSLATVTLRHVNISFEASQVLFSLILPRKLLEIYDTRAWLVSPDMYHLEVPFRHFVYRGTWLDFPRIRGNSTAFSALQTLTCSLTAFTEDDQRPSFSFRSIVSNFDNILALYGKSLSYFRLDVSQIDMRQLREFHFCPALELQLMFLQMWHM